MSLRFPVRAMLRVAVPVGALTQWSCTHPSPTMTVTAAPALPAYHISEPVIHDERSPVHIVSDTTGGELVSIDTHGRDIDAREALQFLADRGGLSLVYGPDINRRVRLKLIDVPIGQALQAVLDAAGLTLEPVGGKKQPRPTTSVVFYQLPVNVDSLSVESIMKRFGVTREVAEMIVDARPQKP